MKNARFFPVVLVLSAVCSLACTVCVQAGVHLTKVRDLPSGHVELVDRGNLLWIQTKESEDKGYYLADLEGNAISEPDYGDNATLVHDLILTTASKTSRSERTNNQGALYPDGQVAIPFSYGWLHILNRHWAVGLVLEEVSDPNARYDYSYYVVTSIRKYRIARADIYHIQDGSVSLAAFLGRDDYLEAQCDGDYIMVRSRASKKAAVYDGNWECIASDLGFIPITDITGALPDTDCFTGTFPFAYTGPFEGEFAIAGDLTHVGLTDRSGNLVLPIRYDAILHNYTADMSVRDNAHRALSAAGIYTVVLDGKIAFVREGGEVACVTELAQNEATLYGSSLTYTDQEEQLHFITSQGKDTVQNDPYLLNETLSPVDYGNGMLFSIIQAIPVEDPDGKNKYRYSDTLIDWECNQLLDDAYWIFSLTGDGKYLLASTGIDEGSVNELYEVGVQ